MRQICRLEATKAPGAAVAAGRSVEEFEGVGVGGAVGAEVAVGGDGVLIVAFGEGDDAGVGGVETWVGVGLDKFSDAGPVAGGELTPLGGIPPSRSGENRLSVVTHLRHIDEVVGSVLDPDELDQLAALMHTLHDATNPAATQVSNRPC